VLDFAKEAREENVLFHRFLPSETILLGNQTLVIESDGNHWHFKPDYQGETAVKEHRGDLYAINYRYMRQQIGFSDLLTYTADALPGRFFRLGFHAEMTICVSHLQGLFPLMKGREKMSLLEALSELRELLQRAAAQAVIHVTGEEPTWENLRLQAGAIQESAEDLLFPLLFVNGLCLMPRSLTIKGFAEPRLTSETT